MKKLVLMTTSIAILTGCAAGIDNSKPVEPRSDLKHICIKEKKTGLNFTSKETVEFISNSLKQKNITSEIYTAQSPNCKYVLSYLVKGKKEIILRGSLTLTEFANNTKNNIGTVSYKYRGKERESAKLTGIQGQFDKMVLELFKNN